MNVEELERLPAARMPAAVYSATTYNNPTGTVLSPERRLALAQMAEREGWTIVEDETLCDISIHDVEPPAPIAALESGATVLSIGSARCTGAVCASAGCAAKRT